MSQTPGGTQPGGAAPASEAKLRAGAVSLVGATVQSVGLIGPAVGVLATTPFIVSIAGPSAAFAFFVAFIIMLGAAIPLARLARELPSAGGYYTYVSRTLHPRLGFMVSWLWLFYTPALPAMNLSILGYLLEGILKSNFHVDVPWWWAILLGTAFLLVIGWSGVAVSARTLVILSGAEIVIIVALAIWGLAVPGHGGFSLAPLSPAGSTGAGVFLGVIFSIFAITGWESAAAAAEETVNPRVNIPRALIASVVITGLFFVITAWGLEVGWGVDSIKSFGTSSVTPAIVLAHRYWGAAWIIVLIAFSTSVLSVTVAANNVSTRMWYAMARSGSLPRVFARLHARNRTPINAVLLQAALTVVIALGVGTWIGPDNVFFFFGLSITVVMVLVYTLGNIGIIRYFWRRPDRQWFVHITLPIVSSILLLVVGYETFNPLPAAPIGLAPLFVAGWAVIGIAVLVVMRLRGREDWLQRAGESMADAEVETLDASPRVKVDD